MPRYFITAPEGFSTHGADGLVLPDTTALATVLRQTLAVMLHDEGQGDSETEFNAEARDENGHQVMTARLNIVTHRP